MIGWVKIRSLTVGTRGKRGLIVTIPNSWAKDHQVKAGDQFAIKATEDGEHKDDLLLHLERRTDESGAET